MHPIKLCLSILFSSTLYAQATAEPRVLYLNSYHSGFYWSDAIERGFADTLAQSGTAIEVFYERLDTKRFDFEKMNALLQPALLEKYGDEAISVIVTSDDNAFNFALQLREAMSTAPNIIFSGVNEQNHPSFAEKVNLTGVLENVDIAGLIELIQQVHPQLSHIAIVADATESALLHTKNTEQILKSEFTQLDYSIHTDWTLASLAGELNQLPEHSVIIDLAFHRDKNGRYLSAADQKQFLETQVPWPAYSLWDSRIGNGVVGGLMTSGRVHGEQAAQMLLDIMAGAPIESLPIQTQIPFPKYFDYQQLQRLGINQRQLPADAQVLNEPNTFWFRYQRYLLWAALFLLFQTLLILVLVFNVQKRKKAQQSLFNLNEDLEQLVRRRTLDLTQTIERLESTQLKLVETEKMAALAGVVAGIAHKLNTPIGVCVTATSILKQDHQQSGDANTLEAIRLLESNLNFLAAITRDFKQISIDTNQETPTMLAMPELIDTIVGSFAGQLATKAITVNIDCAADAQLVSYHQVWVKILSNFIGNSLLHGFTEDQAKKVIFISLQKVGEAWHLHYSDNGKGINSEHNRQIFEPFFTTRFGVGSSGLGLNIVYNEVTHRLNGTIEVDNSHQPGLALLVKVPPLNSSLAVPPLNSSLAAQPVQSQL